LANTTSSLSHECYPPLCVGKFHLPPLGWGPPLVARVRPPSDTIDCGISSPRSLSSPPDPNATLECYRLRGDDVLTNRLTEPYSLLVCLHSPECVPPPFHIGKSPLFSVTRVSRSVQRFTPAAFIPFSVEVFTAAPSFTLPRFIFPGGSGARSVSSWLWRCHNDACVRFLQPHFPVFLDFLSPDAVICQPSAFLWF